MKPMKPMMCKGIVAVIIAGVMILSSVGLFSATAQANPYSEELSYQEGESNLATTQAPNDIVVRFGNDAYFTPGSGAVVTFAPGPVAAPGVPPGVVRATGATVGYDGNTNALRISREGLPVNNTQAQNTIRATFNPPLPAGWGYEIRFMVYVPIEGNPGRTTPRGGPNTVRWPVTQVNAAAGVARPSVGNDYVVMPMGEWVEFNVFTRPQSIDSPINFVDIRIAGTNAQNMPLTWYMDRFQINVATPNEEPLTRAGLWEFWRDRYDTPSLHETFADYFPIGNIIEPAQIAPWLTDMFNFHYNQVTAENALKPGPIWGNNPTPIGLNPGGAARTVINWANYNNIPHHGHTLVWHSQSPGWPGAAHMNRTAAEARMRLFIDTIVDATIDDIVGWDVLNEVFWYGVNYERDNPEDCWRNHVRHPGFGTGGSISNWWIAYNTRPPGGGAEIPGDYELWHEQNDPTDFIYDAFVFTRLALERHGRHFDVPLYYNDFNEEIVPKNYAIADMVIEMNNRWMVDERNNHPYLPLINVIGMQSHFWTGWIVAEDVRYSIQVFTDVFAQNRAHFYELLMTGQFNHFPVQQLSQFRRLAAVHMVPRLSITEMDIPHGTYYNQHHGAPLTEREEMLQAVQFAELFQIYREYADIIEAVTFWLRDDDHGWRNVGMPGLFDVFGRPKLAFWAVVDSDEFLARPEVVSFLESADLTVTLENYDGQGGAKTLDVRYMQTIDRANVVIPDRPGYLFMGWEIVSGEPSRLDSLARQNRMIPTAPFALNSFHHRITEDLVLRALWGEELKAVFIADADYARPQVQVVDLHDFNTFPEVFGVIQQPVRLGYNFVGWFNPEGIQVTTGPVAGGNYYARWESANFGPVRYQFSFTTDHPRYSMLRPLDHVVLSVRNNVGGSVVPFPSIPAIAPHLQVRPPDYLDNALRVDNIGDELHPHPRMAELGNVLEPAPNRRNGHQNALRIDFGNNPLPAGNRYVIQFMVFIPHEGNEPPLVGANPLRMAVNFNTFQSNRFHFAADGTAGTITPRGRWVQYTITTTGRGLVDGEMEDFTLERIYTIDIRFNGGGAGVPLVWYLDNIAIFNYDQVVDVESYFGVTFPLNWDAVVALPSLYQAWEDYFPVGNIVEPFHLGAAANSIRDRYVDRGRQPNVTPVFDRHFNFVTSENVMKPLYHALGWDDVNQRPIWAWEEGIVGGYPVIGLTSDIGIFLDWSVANNLPIQAHTLVWHSGQSPWWLNQTVTGAALPRAEAQRRMSVFIDEYVVAVRRFVHARAAVHHPERNLATDPWIVNWDVVNEVVTGAPPNIPAGSSIEALKAAPANAWQAGGLRTTPWGNAFANQMDAAPPNADGQPRHRSDYIYEAFVLTRLADPLARLYYNDYNEISTGRTATTALMARDMNNRWAADPRNPSRNNSTHPDYGRPLIEALGMQAHFWAGRPNTFRTMSGAGAPGTPAAIAGDHTDGQIQNVITAMERYTHVAGLDIAATEWDIPLGNWGSFNPLVRLQEQLLTPIEARQMNIITARLLSEYRNHQREYGNFTRLTIWGVSDNMHWRGGGMPVLFDFFGRPKENFDAFLDPEGFLEDNTFTITFITHGDGITRHNVHLQRERLWGQVAASPMGGDPTRPGTGGALGVPDPVDVFNPSNTFLRWELVPELSVVEDLDFAFNVDGFEHHGRWDNFNYGILGDMVFRAVWEEPFGEGHDVFVYAEVKEWGQSVTAVIVDMEEVVTEAQINDMDIEVSAFKTTRRIVNANNPLVVFDDDKKITAIYVSNVRERLAPGDRPTSGNYLVIELQYGFDNTRAQVNGSATFCYNWTAPDRAPYSGPNPYGGQAYRLNMEYVVTIDGTAHVVIIDCGTNNPPRLIQPIVDDFELVANPVDGFTNQFYRMWTPPAHRGTQNPATPKPLVLFHHGFGETYVVLANGNSNEGVQLIAQEAATSWVTEAPEYAYVMVVQRGTGEGAPGYSRAGVSAFIDHLIEEGRVDADRVYISGLSMGGLEVLNHLYEFPELFAAAIPICPVQGNSVANMARLSTIKHVPIWYVHSATDSVVNPLTAVEPHARLLELGAADARISNFPAVQLPGSRGGWAPRPETGADTWSVFGNHLPNGILMDGNGNPALFYPNDHWNWIMVFNNIYIECGGIIPADPRYGTAQQYGITFMDWMFAQRRGGEAPDELSFDIFNNGVGGSPSRPNPGLAASGTIRMWTQINGVNTPVLYADLTVTAEFANGDCAMRFVRVNRPWVAQETVNFIDVDKNGPWDRIYLTATVNGSTVTVILVNDFYVPTVLSLDIFNNGPNGTPGRPNANLGPIIRMWTQINGVNTPVLFDDLRVTATLPNGDCAMAFVVINRPWVAQHTVNFIDVRRDRPWEVITLTIEVNGKTATVILCNL